MNYVQKRGKELVKTVFVTVSWKGLFYNRYKINDTFSYKTFTADHVRLKRLAYADLAENKHNFFNMNCYCFRYSFSLALISSMAPLEYASLRLTVVV